MRWAACSCCVKSEEQQWLCPTHVIDSYNGVVAMIQGQLGQMGNLVYSHFEYSGLVLSEGKFDLYIHGHNRSDDARCDVYANCTSTAFGHRNDLWLRRLPTLRSRECACRLSRRFRYPTACDPHTPPRCRTAGTACRFSTRF